MDAPYEVIAGKKVFKDEVEFTAEPAAYVAALKTDYTTGNLDTEAEIIAAVNATNAAINAILTKLQSIGMFKAS